MGQGQVTASSQAAAEYGSDFASAHQALRADKAVQFNLAPADPPPKPPQWLKNFLEWLGDALKQVRGEAGGVLSEDGTLYGFSGGSFGGGASRRR